MKLEFIGLSKNYGDVQALDNFTATMNSGIYGILGPNGAGKSTLMNILTDNLKRDSGRILYDGVDILDMGEQYRRLVGYVPQEQICYPQFTGVEFLRYMAKVKGLNMRWKDIQTQIETLLEQVHLSEAAKRRIGTYSGGMKRRIILAQALLGRPEILLMDEPTAGLDPAERIAMRNLITQLSYDKIVILATHIASDIECIADSVLLMKNGQVLRNEPPFVLMEEIKASVKEVFCTKEELLSYQEKYKSSHFIQKKDGLALRFIDRSGEVMDTKAVEDVTLEDVYLYHFDTAIM